ncbi:uncharacterized protein LOC143232802 isoform X3 [Tachypleus tridentatus]|uniref:uncharacterized protein LOC143232802 isoform X3 n=1 Tax=Tachypleus tridentatus TaxID=6853 RepID=UPI003FD4F677
MFGVGTFIIGEKYVNFNHCSEYYDLERMEHGVSDWCGHLKKYILMLPVWIIPALAPPPSQFWILAIVSVDGKCREKRLGHIKNGST